MTGRNQKYIRMVKIDEIPWNRLTTPYKRATLFPQYFEVLEDMQDMDKIKTALYEIIINVEHQSTLWHATPFAVIFLIRIFTKALDYIKTNKNAYYIAEKLLEVFAIIAESVYEAEKFKHPEPLPFFEDMLKEEYLWSEVYDEDEDELRYDEGDVFPDNLFYSFYFYSFYVLKTHREVFIKLKNTEFDKMARTLYLLSEGKKHYYNIGQNSEIK